MKSNIVELTIKSFKGEARIDSRLIALELNIKHQSLVENIRKYQIDFEHFGILLFKTGEIKGRGQPEKYALLNEDQSIFLMTLSRNTPRVVQLKARLVMAFSRFREGQQSEADYLPFYHALHDEVKHLAITAHDAGSTTPERIFHINVNKMINAAFGLPSGERPTLPPELRVYITTANLLVRQSLRESLDAGLDHKNAYTEAKQRLSTYVQAIGATLLPGKVA